MAAKKYCMLRVTPEAHAALYDSQKPHESFSDTILRLVKGGKK